MSQSSSSKIVRTRCWVDIDGEKFFGPGRAELLKLIEETGSISKAAKTMGMSYKKAWGMVNEMNAKATRPYVISQKGGSNGGGAQITGEGKKILKSYLKLIDKINLLVEKESNLLELI